MSARRRGLWRARPPAVVAAVSALASTLVALVASPAAAVVPTASVVLPVAIESMPPYQPQTFCEPTVRPGTQALADLLTSTYAGTAIVSLTRSCGSDRSEHYDGRAVDWGVDHRNDRQRAQGRAFLHWLFAADASGEADAMVRRLGIMYVIWNKRIWGSWSGGWEPYSCSGATACHVDHIHLSLDWSGAMRKTSFWTGEVRPPMDPPLVTVSELGEKQSMTVSARDADPPARYKLLADARYKVVVTGTYHYDGARGHRADAACSRAAGEWSRHAPGETRATRGLLDLWAADSHHWRARTGRSALRPASSLRPCHHSRRAAAADRLGERPAALGRRRVVHGQGAPHRLTPVVRWPPWPHRRPRARVRRSAPLSSGTTCAPPSPTSMRPTDRCGCSTPVVAAAASRCRWRSSATMSRSSTRARTRSPRWSGAWRDAGGSAQVRAVQGDATELSGLVPAGEFDVVLCHSVLEVVDDPAEALRVDRRRAAARRGGERPRRQPDGGGASRGLPPAASVRPRRLLDRRRGRGRLRRSAGAPVHPGRAAAAARGRRAATSRVVHGVRVFTDIVPAALLDGDPAAVDDLLALERAVAERTDYLGGRDAAARARRSRLTPAGSRWGHEPAAAAADGRAAGDRRATTPGAACCTSTWTPSTPRSSCAAAPSSSARRSSSAGWAPARVVLSATYEARAFGVHSAMPMSRARRLCPHATVIPPDHDDYAEASRGVHGGLPVGHPAGRAAGARRGVPRRRRAPAPARPPAADRRADPRPGRRRAGHHLLGRVSPRRSSSPSSPRRGPSRTGCSSSRATDVVAFLHPLPVGALWGVGEKTEEALTRLGLRTIGDIAATPRRDPAAGARARPPARTCPRWPGAATSAAVVPHEPDKSIGAEETFARDVDDPAVVRRELLRLSERTAARLRATGQVGPDGGDQGALRRLHDDHPVARPSRSRPTSHGWSTRPPGRSTTPSGWSGRASGWSASGSRGWPSGTSTPRQLALSGGGRRSGGRRSRRRTGRPPGSAPVRCGRRPSWSRAGRERTPPP